MQTSPQADRIPTPVLSSAKRGGATPDRAIGLWLLATGAMIFIMFVIGAITRLTESGLSIMEWAPIAGILPPSGQAEWQRLFDLYRTIPEYQQINPTMSLADFKEIFWWEYLHRLWGRLIGLVFVLPFAWFFLTGRIRRDLVPHLAAMLFLGAAQGALGWYMVASGFAERGDVSQYRLVAHLMMAIAIYGYILWVALGLIGAGHVPAPGAAHSALRLGLIAFLALLLITLASGGFVAGLNAGFIYNSFPLMDGRLVPADYAALTPAYLNLFENAATVQFNHRVLAIASAAAAAGLWLWSRRLPIEPGAKRALTWLLVAAAVQVALGIGALLLVVPVWLGALHQAGALAFFTLALWALQCLRPPRLEKAGRSKSH